MAFYIYKNNQQSGPFEEAYIVDGLRRGSFSASDLACREGDSRWLPLETFFPLETGRREEYRQPPAAHRWMSDAANLKAEPQPQRPPIQQYPPQSPGGNVYQPPAQTHQPLAPSPPPQVHHVIHQQVGPTYGAPQGSALPVIAMSMGIVTASLMLIGLIPCLGWVNWMTLIVGGISNLLCWVSIITEKQQDSRNKALIGLVLTFIALFVGLIRLIIGGGCI
jgi:hypothetical protein